MTAEPKEPEHAVSKSPPPPFGHPMLKFFGFDPSYTNLNHGSYGSLPNPVLQAGEKLSREIEANPDKFMRVTHLPLLDTVRERIANLIGAERDECVLVPNATHGVNTVLRNFDWHQGDIIVGAATTYGAISRTIQYIHDIPPHPSISTFYLKFPSTHAEIIKNWRTHLKGLARFPGQKVVAVIDSIVSNPGVKLPWREMVKICREENIWTVIDAAHSIGQEPNLNMKEDDPDFFVSNCHKWLYAKRGCCVLYVPKRNQHIIKTTLPTSFDYVSPVDPDGAEYHIPKRDQIPNTDTATDNVSHKGPKAEEVKNIKFVAQFDWTGTIDFVPYLSVSPALDFRQWLGGEAAIDKYCHKLAMDGGKRLAKILGTSVMDETGELTAHMVNVELPLPGVPPLADINVEIRDLLLKENIYAAHFPHEGKWWTRCSAQVWLEVSDFEKLGETYLTICKDITARFGKIGKTAA